MGKTSPTLGDPSADSAVHVAHRRAPAVQLRSAPWRCPTQRLLRGLTGPDGEGYQRESSSDVAPALDFAWW
jgi:hypothetical protein